MTTAKEAQFFDALRDIFVGARIEGDSGFVNLMRIKSRYYERGILPHLQKDIEDALKPFPEFREELFDRLYTFFRRYFSESGSIYFRFTPPHDHIYERVYVADRDVALFWKTHMLYYVKTDRLFRNMRVEVDGFRFAFDVSTLQHKRANERRTLIYAFSRRDEDGTLVFAVAYAENGRKTDLDAIRRAIRDRLGLDRFTAAVPTEETLERAFRLFERQAEVDFFINKDARRFLREQFHLWLYQYVFEPEQAQGTLWTEPRIRQLQALKSIAYKIIDFIAQFEDELVRIWNKPKFVLGSHYVITLDRIAAQDGGMDLLRRILAHPGMRAQVQEWRDLGIVSDDFSLDQIWQTDPDGRRLHPRYQHLPLDTRHIPDLETALLALFDHLDQQLDGWLVHSENYQALVTLCNKWRGKVGSIYIDPPYNTNLSEIDYINGYKHASWLSMVENRISQARLFLNPGGILCVTIDHAELHNLRALLSSVFNDENVLGLVSIVNNPSGRSTVKGFSVANEFALFIGHSEESKIGALPRSDDQLAQYPERDENGLFQWRSFMRAGGMNDFRSARPRLYYPLFVKGDKLRIPELEWSDQLRCWQLLEHPQDGEEIVYPISSEEVEYTWRLQVDTLRTRLNDLRVRRNREGRLVIEIKFRPDAEGILPKTVWDDERYNSTVYGTSLLKDLMGQAQSFSFPKSVYAVMDCIRASTTTTSAFVLDFFAGSGTTAHAVINLNREDGGRRKYIMVEMADYFHTVLLPRVKKVVFSDKWRDGKAQPEGAGIGHFVKYFRLEQYEDVLRKASYGDEEEPLFYLEYQQNPYARYVFLRDTKMLDDAETGRPVMSLDYERNRVRLDLSLLYPDIDLAETLSCLTGRWIRRIHPDPDDPRRPGRVEFEDGTTADLLSPDWELVKPLIWWCER